MSKLTRRAAAGIAVAALGIAACSSNGSSKNAPTHVSAASTSSASTVLVTGRASTPTDINAPGIKMPDTSSQFSVSIGDSDVVVTGGDWNTIVATSKVAPNVGVEFASGFNWTATTRNRFQYLADRIAKADESQDFDPIGVATGVTDKTATTIVALYNPSSQAGTLTGLKITITTAPGKTVLGTGEFFTTANSSVAIPAKSIMFTRLEVPVEIQPKGVNGSLPVSDSFHYDQFAPA